MKFENNENLVFSGQTATMVLTCRFYANEFPEVEETVMVNVKQVEGMGAYVLLSEYNNKGGFWDFGVFWSMVWGILVSGLPLVVMSDGNSQGWDGWRWL